MSDQKTRLKEAEALYDSEQYDKAVPLLQALSNEGYARGQCLLGLFFGEGHGVPQDKAKAVEWYRKAADQELDTAQYILGLCYHNGEGVPQDKTQAVEWFRKAAGQGLPAAQNTLGGCYYHGEGVEQDKTQAAEWYRKAAEQGDAEAQNNLGICYYNGEGVPQDKAKATEWYRKAAEQGYAEAQKNLDGLDISETSGSHSFTAGIISKISNSIDNGFTLLAILFVVLCMLGFGMGIIVILHRIFLPISGSVPEAVLIISVFVAIAGYILALILALKSGKKPLIAAVLALGIIGGVAALKSFR